MVLVASAASAAKEPNLAELFELVDPAVVEIATIQETISDTGTTKRTRVDGDVILGIQVGVENFGAKVEQAVNELGEDGLLELKVLRAGQIISLSKPIGELR